MARRDPGPLEKEWDKQVCDLAAIHGWKLRYHAWSSLHSPSGFPDRVFLRGQRIVFAELKRLYKDPTPAQEEWLDALAIAGVEVYLWRPDDFDDVKVVLSSKTRPTQRLASRWLPPVPAEPARKVSGQ